MTKFEDQFEQLLKDNDRKFEDLELKTFWKIKDFEELLQKRVNEEFVRDMVRTEANKLRTYTDGQIEKQQPRHDRVHKEINLKIQEMEQKSWKTNEVIMNNEAKAAESVEDLTKKTENNMEHYKDQQSTIISGIKSIQATLKERTSNQ